jgi:hypothetical protein
VLGTGGIKVILRNLNADVFSYKFAILAYGMAVYGSPIERRTVSSYHHSKYISGSMHDYIAIYGNVSLGISHEASSTSRASRCIGVKESFNAHIRGFHSSQWCFRSERDQDMADTAFS